MNAPANEPARSIYFAFHDEAAQRKGRSSTEWIDAERIAVWNAAREYAKANGIPVLSLKEIEMAENLAVGHVDYPDKWACRVAEMILKRRENQE